MIKFSSTDQAIEYLLSDHTGKRIVKMIKFSSTDQALQRLADHTGKRIVIAKEENKESFYKKHNIDEERMGYLGNGFHQVSSAASICATCSGCAAARFFVSCGSAARSNSSMFLYFPATGGDA